MIQKNYLLTFIGHAAKSHLEIEMVRIRVLLMHYKRNLRHLRKIMKNILRPLNQLNQIIQIGYQKQKATKKHIKNSLMLL